MKTKLTTRSTLYYVFFILWLLGTTISVSAQCPTIADSNPPPICDASGFTFNDLNVYAVDGGNGIVWYNAATGGTAFNSNQFVQEGIYYADDNSGNCGTRMSVTIDFQVEATGITLDGIYCSNDNATVQTYIDEVLLPNMPIGGSMEVYEDSGLATLATATDILALGPTSFFVVFIDSSNCRSQVEIGSTAVFQSVDDPTPPNNPMFCADVAPTIGDLDPGTTSTTFSWYAGLDGFGNPVPPAMLLTTPLVDGNTYYIQVDDFFCESNPAAVTVTINTPVNSGTSANLEYCNDNLPIADFNLLDELTGSPDPSGTWSGPLATSNGNLGTVNISTLTTAGTYIFTYTVPSTGVCPDGVSNVTINVFETLSSGTLSTGAQSTFCVSILPTAFDLFTLLDGEDVGGQWTRGATSTDPVVASPIDLNGLTVGIYDFTYTQNILPNPCPEASTTVQVTVIEDPNAGLAINQTFCENDLAANSPFNLFDALDGSQDNNSGVWADASSLPTSNIIDISGFTAAGSPYNFTYTINNGICFDVEIVTITVPLTPESGTPVGTFPDFCEGSASSSFDLFDLLDGEDQTGTWYIGTDNTGATATNPTDLSTLTAGTYNFTFDVDAIGACDDPLVTVQVIINPLPNTGTPNNPPAFCENDPALNNTAFDLFTLLNAPLDLGGTWTDNDTSGALTGNTLDLSALLIGTYNFTYSITDANNCSNSTTVTIVIDDAPESGTVNTPTEFCEGSASSSFDLFDLLDGEDQTGTWYIGTDNTGTTATNPTDLSTLTAGTYNFTFDVDAIGACDDALVTVQVIINPLPNTGTPNNPPAFCENDPALNNTTFDLFTLLNAPVDLGGTWTDDDTSGALIGNTLDLSALAMGTYNFTYGITDANNCSNSTTVTIVIDDAPESGTVNTPTEFCEGSASSSFDLFDLLNGEDQTGTWYIGTDNTGTTATNPTDLSTLTAGTYNFTFDVDAIGACDDPLVTVQVIINPLPNTGTPNNPPAFCENDPALNNTAFDLFTLLNAPVDLGGTWTDNDTSGALTGNNLDLSALLIGTYNFTYSITDANNCSNSTTVTIVIDDAPESGTVNTPTEFCEGSASSSFDLFDLLNGEDQTGTWFVGTDNTGATATNPTDLSTLTAGTYNFTFDVDAIGACDDALVTVQVIINPLPNTGIPNNPPAFCENDPALNNTAFDLFTLLNAPVDLGGTWTDNDTSGALTGNNLDLSALLIGTYNFTYSITDANNCSNSTTVTIVIDDAPESGTVNTPAEFCVVDITAAQTVDLFDLLDGEDQTGTWNDDNASGALSGNIVTIDGLSANTYNFTFNVDAIGACDDVDVTVSIIINDTPVPTTASIIQEFCDAAMVSELSATGTAIQWYDDATGGVPLAGATVLVDGETYYATQTNATTNCESSVRLEVTARVYQSPNSGNLNATTILACNNANNIDLFTGLDGTQDAGGVWQDTDGTTALTGNVFDATGIAAGTYQFTYLVTASAPCINASTTITVTIEESLNAGTDNTLDVCSNNGTTDLFTLLGNADTGGTWSPALTSGTGVFDPLVDADGTYTYSFSNACGMVSSNVIVTVTQIANAGADNSVSMCVIDDPTDLFTFLGADAQSGGTWSPVLTSGTGLFDPANDAAGVYTYTVIAVSPCTIDASAEITITVNDTPAIVILESNPSFCLADNPIVADLTNNIRPTGTVNWYEDIALTLPLNDADTLIDGEDYYATQTNSSGCESSTSIQVNVTINDAATPTLIDGTVAYCINDGPTINDLLLNITEYDSVLDNIVWYDTEIGGSTISSTTILSHAITYYAALIDATSGCESSVRLEVTPDLTACGKLILPDGFSPNGDGVNDTFDIDNLDIIFPNFEIEIYNRYGNVVYKGKADSPPFDGQSNQSRTIAKGDLPVGVYFYIFNFNDGENKPEQGRLYLSR